MPEKITIKEHIFAKLANDIRDACQKRERAQCLREGIIGVLREYFKFEDKDTIPNVDDTGYSWTTERPMPDRFFVFGNRESRKWLDRKGVFPHYRQIPQLLAELSKEDKTRFLKWIEQDGIDIPNDKEDTSGESDKFQLNDGRWFDKNTYDFEYKSWALAEYCSEHFDKWFDPNTYNFKEDSWKLTEFCTQHFDKWFDLNTYNFKDDSWALAQYCQEHFDKWFDKETYNFEKQSWALTKHCSNYFDKWFDPKTFNFECSKEMLVKFCQEHKSKWEQFVR